MCAMRGEIVRSSEEREEVVLAPIFKRIRSISPESLLIAATFRAVSPQHPRFGGVLHKLLEYPPAAVPSSKVVVVAVPSVTPPTTSFPIQCSLCSARVRFPDSPPSGPSSSSSAHCSITIPNRYCKGGHFPLDGGKHKMEGLCPWPCLFPASVSKME